MRISRRLFVVLLADGSHGKSTATNALVSQGLAAGSPGQKGQRQLVSPWGREIDSYVFIRSYQEKEKGNHQSVVMTLDRNDPSWRLRELIIFPSHVSGASADIDEMIDAAHSAGFDIISASLILTGEGGDDLQIFGEIWGKNWDERWTLPNPIVQNPTMDEWAHWKRQVEALGRDLWTWICRALAM